MARLSAARLHSNSRTSVLPLKHARCRSLKQQQNVVIQKLTSPVWLGTESSNPCDQREAGVGSPSEPPIFREDQPRRILHSRVYTISPAASSEARRAAMANPNCWSRTIGTQRGTRIRVYERAPGSILQVSAWIPTRGESRQSLGHRDKDRALREARELLKLAGSPPAAGQPSAGSALTLGVLFGRYVAEGRYLPDGSLKTEAYLRHVSS